MSVRLRAWFILPIVLALASLRLEGDADPAAAVSGTYTPDEADLCDWSEGHVVAVPSVPPPSVAAQDHQMKTILLKLAKRLVEVQQKTPDPHIQTIIDQCRLGDTAALAALSPADARQTLVRTAMSLIEAAKTDTLVAHLTGEFKISFKTAPPPPPASPPSTNAPTAAAT